MKTQSAATAYEIRLKGHLGPNTLTWFESFAAEHSPDGETILRGPLVDQAALSGVLSRILDLGLSLTSFRALGEVQTLAGASADSWGKSSGRQSHE